MEPIIGKKSILIFQAHLWEWLWLLSAPLSLIGVSACKKSNANAMTQVNNYSLIYHGPWCGFPLLNSSSPLAVLLPEPGDGSPTGGLRHDLLRRRTSRVHLDEERRKYRPVAGKQAQLIQSVLQNVAWLEPIMVSWSCQQIAHLIPLYVVDLGRRLNFKIYLSSAN